LPTRLLDILPREGSEVRLVDTAKSPPADKRYLALSHCWGQYAPLHTIKLENAKLDVYLQDIPLETLPKTFKDAVRITRELGLRYIWIDSLCIIQDSPEDWEKEASLMHTVYKNAYCTVAAAASRDGSGGCFVQGPYAPLQAGFEGLFPRVDVPRGVMPSLPPVWKKMIESGPLGSRAWCFQERQLSPRVVHFTIHGLMWECRTCIATEDKPQSGLEPIGRCHDRSLDKGVRRSRTELLYDRWIDGVANYTSREMTKSSDRFPALSGLAQAVIEATGDTYLAGLWRGDLCRRLLWSRAYLDSAPERTRHWTRPTEPEYRAPSWSWASINGPV
ncbi:HET-domain-containing protein, partial [Stipitochalara longipes BDJ]